MQTTDPIQAHRHWLITGVSSGFGRELAEAALARGDKVVGTLRQAAQAQAFSQLAPDRSLGVVLDVTNSVAIPAALQQALALAGHIDVLVNNAGYGFFAAIEETTMAEARQVMETNFFGLLTVTQALLPHLRSRRRGHVINLSSMAGIVGLPGCGLYNASKFAVEGLTEALAIELAPLGIHVTVIEPGGFRTNFGAGSMRMGERIIDDYAQTAGRSRQGMQAFSAHAKGDPKKAAAAILQVVDTPNPPLRLVLGQDVLRAARQKVQQLQQQLDAWEALSVGTNFD
ncbi:MAG TPA: oxidoreductase [Ramlibacter sp.]|nr:oxidoreductase [Ramlibacter sp.]